MPKTGKKGFRKKKTLIDFCKKTFGREVRKRMFFGQNQVVISPWSHKQRLLSHGYLKISKALYVWPPRNPHGSTLFLPLFRNLWQTCSSSAYPIAVKNSIFIFLHCVTFAPLGVTNQWTEAHFPSKKNPPPPPKNRKKHNFSSCNCLE